jgi:hypothetical protein
VSSASGCAAPSLGVPSLDAALAGFPGAASPPSPGGVGFPLLDFPSPSKLTRIPASRHAATLFRGWREPGPGPSSPRKAARRPGLPPSRFRAPSASREGNVGGLRSPARPSRRSMPRPIRPRRFDDLGGPFPSVPGLHRGPLLGFASPGAVPFHPSRSVAGAGATVTFRAGPSFRRGPKPRPAQRLRGIEVQGRCPPQGRFRPRGGPLPGVSCRDSSSPANRRTEPHCLSRTVNERRGARRKLPPRRSTAKTAAVGSGPTTRIRRPDTRLRGQFF